MIEYPSERCDAGSELHCASSSANPREGTVPAAHSLWNNHAQENENLAKLGSGKAETYFQSPNMPIPSNHISVSGSCDWNRRETGISWVTSRKSCF